MKRHALLIEASRLKDHPDLPGARTDVRLLRSWLIDPRGGAWHDEEIVILSHPTVEAVKKRLAKAKECDYAFVSFSGHGHHVVGNGFNQTRVCLNDDEEISDAALNPKNQRSTVLIDSCRGLTVLVPQQLLESYVKKAIQLSLNSERESARAKFDRLVRQSEAGVIYLYSCSVDQSAAEDKNGQGGLFTLGLVRSGQNWKPPAPTGYYWSVRNAFYAAAAYTTKENPQQKPRWAHGDRNRFFPFALAI